MWEGYSVHCHQLEAERSEQLEGLERDSQTKGASSENEDISKRNVEAVCLAGAAQPLI